MYTAKMGQQLLAKIVCVLGVYICFPIGYTFGEGIQISYERLNEIDGTLKDLLQCRDGKSIQGLAASIVYKGEKVFARGYGVTDQSQPQPVTENTMFGIGPLTKTLTSTLLIKQLHDHPSFTLDTPLSKMLPGNFRFHDKLRTSLASSRDLLDNKLGLVPHRYMVFQQGLTRKRLAFKMRHMRRAGKFRDSYINSDIMYSLAAFVSETLSKSTWERLMEKEIFVPLNMTYTSFFNQLNTEIKGLASAYLRRKGHLKKLSVNYFREASKLGGAQSVVSNAIDMAKWMLFILSNGRTKYGRRLVHQKVITESYSSPNKTTYHTESTLFQSPVFPNTWNDFGPHKAWREGEYRGERVLSSIKSGRSLVVGYESHITLFLSSEIGIFTTSTGNGLNPLALTALHAYISDVMLGLDRWLNSSTICAFPAPWFRSPSNIKSFRPPADEQLKSKDYHLFVGVYYNSIYGRIIVFYNKATGRLQLQYGAIRANLHPLKARGKFRAKGLRDFWLFKITCIFTTKADKSTSLSIPDFVPNYPTNPMLFKYTDIKIPEEYMNISSVTPTIYQDASSTQTTDGDKDLFSLSTSNSAPTGIKFEQKTLPTLNSTFSVSKVSSGIASRSGTEDQSTSLLQTTDPLPPSTHFPDGSAVTLTMTQSATRSLSMEYTRETKIGSSEISANPSTFYSSTHVIKTSTVPNDNLDTSVSEFSQSKYPLKVNAITGIQTSEITSPIVGEGTISTAHDILATESSREMETPAFETLKNEEGKPDLMTNEPYLKLSTETSQRSNSPNQVQDVAAAGQTVSYNEIGKTNTKPTLLDVSGQFNDEGDPNTGTTMIARPKLNSATKFSHTEPSVTSSSPETTTGLYNSTKNTMKDMDKEVLNSNPPNSGKSKYFQKNYILRCLITSIILLMWF